MSHPGSPYYEIFVQSFCDSNGDGIGDLNGVTSKLDYLQDLGIGGIWLMPINPSPSYHKYDVTNYYEIHPDYGTIADFRRLIEAARQKGIKVIIDLVINHCSAEHPWFQEAMINEDSVYRDYFIWATDEEIEAMGNNTKEVAEDSDNIYQWNTVPGQEKKYFSYFWSGMPDLNYDNPRLREEIYRIGHFWLKDIGVDGFRLDAAKHIYPDHRAADNHAFWQEFRGKMEEAKRDVFLVGEVWDNAHFIAPFLKGLKSAFNFDLSREITDAVNKGKGNELVNRYLEIQQVYREVTEDYLDAIFLKNHDQIRVRSALKNRIGKAQVAAAILLTLPGCPFLYYGEEIGMLGRKPDSNIREPFLWSNEGSETPRWMKPKYSLPENVRALDRQVHQPSSIFNHYKKLIAFRRDHQAIHSGSIEPLEVENDGICCFRRSYGEQTLHVFHNLTSKKQSITACGNEIIFETRSNQHENDLLTLAPFATAVLQ